MTGYELARKLRALFPANRLRLIALTGYGDESVREKCRAAGFDACVVKPGDIEEIQRLVAGDLPAPSNSPT